MACLSCLHGATSGTIALKGLFSVYYHLLYIDSDLCACAMLPMESLTKVDIYFQALITKAANLAPLSKPTLLQHRSQRDVEASGDQHCSFAPGVNDRSKAMLERSDLPSDFLQRQQYLAAVTAEKRALYRNMVEESQCTFQPEVRSSRNSWFR